MNLHSEWMTNNTLFGDDYTNQLQIQQAKERFELQKLSNEGKDATIDGVSERVVTQVHTNSFTPNKDHIKLHTSLESAVKTGSIVKINNIDYIVTDDIKNNGAYKSTEMLQTNNTLKFYNQNGISSAIPCIFSDGNVNLDEGRFLSLPSGHYLVTIPSGYITKSDTNMRYILNDAPYKTFGINNATNGLVKIELIDDSFNEKDDRTNGVAWNIGNPVHNYTIEILNGTEQTVQYGETLTLNVQVKDYGIIVSPTPSLIFTTSNGTVCTVNSSGIITATSDSGSATITVKLASDLTVLASITIIASPATQVNSTYTFVGDVQPDNQLLFNQTKIYTATKFDGNNTAISTQFLFQVIGDTPTDKYVLTVVDDSHCTLKCLGYPYTVTLRAIDINNLQYIDKPILFKSLM